MHTHSDIAGLFSTLADNAKGYQEIAALRGLDSAGSHWALLREVHDLRPSASSGPSARPERPQRG